MMRYDIKQLFEYKPLLPSVSLVSSYEMEMMMLENPHVAA